MIDNDLLMFFDIIDLCNGKCRRKLRFTKPRES